MRNFAQPRLIALLKATAFLLDHSHTPVSGLELMRATGQAADGAKKLNPTQHRAFERLKEDLLDLGVPLVKTTTLDDQHLYQIQRKQYALRNLGLSSEEEVTLSLLARVLAEDEGCPLRDHLGLALQKISAVAENQPQRFGPDQTIAGSPDKAEPCQDPVILDRLVEANAHHYPVTFDYTSFHSGTTTNRHVEPYGFFTRKGVWYLVGRDVDTDTIKVFRTSRIPNRKSLKVDKKKTFTVPRDFNLKNYASVPPWNFLYEKEEREVSVEIDTEEYWRVSEFCQTHGQVDESHEGIVHWHLKARDYDPLVKWMLPYGTAMRPAGPSDFVERYRAVVRETLARYGS